MNIYVGNLPYSVTEDDLQSAFAAFGDVTKVSLITDRETGRAKGFGFVEMASGGDDAIEALNNTDLGGRNIRVSEAKPRESRPPRRF